MTCHRKYTFVFEPTESGFNVTRVLGRLNEACEKKWWFNSPTVTVNEFMVVTIQVVGRDQWWAHRRVMDLMDTVGYDVPVPTWETLPPHTNRGYSRVRK